MITYNFFQFNFIVPIPKLKKYIIYYNIDTMDPLLEIIEPEKDAPYYHYLLKSYNHVVAKYKQIDERCAKNPPHLTASQKKQMSIDAKVKEIMDREIQNKQDNLESTSHRLPNRKKKQLMDDFIKTRTAQVKKQVIAEMKALEDAEIQREKEEREEDIRIFGPGFRSSNEKDEETEIDQDPSYQKGYYADLLRLAVFRFKVLKNIEDKREKKKLWKSEKENYGVWATYICKTCKRKTCDCEDDNCGSCIIFPEKYYVCTCSDDYFNELWNDALDATK